MIDTGSRRRDIAAIHVMAKQLGMDDNEYRDHIFSVTAKRSCSDLDYTGLARVKAHFQQILKVRGIRVPEQRRGGGRGPRPAGDRAPMLGKIDAMLAAAGRTRDYLERGADGRPSMIQRMFHVDRLAFLNPQQLHKLVAALEYDKGRQAARAMRAAEGRA